MPVKRARPVRLSSVKQLTVIDGPQIGRTFDLTHVSQASLGSGSRATLRLEGAAIGGIQAQLARQGERLVLSNAHCEIPVFVNGEPLGRDRVLEQGDRIVAANVMLLFHLESGDRDASPEGIALPLIDEPAVAEARVRFHHNAQKLLESFDRTSDPALCFGSLVQVASALMNRLTLEELLPRVLEIVFEVIPADRGAVLLCEAPDRLLRPVATHRRPHAPEIEGQLPVSRTIVAHLLSHREGILTRDAPTDSRFGEEASIDVLGIRSAICVPLVSSDDAVLGVIHLDTTTAEHRLEEDHLRLLTGIAVFASMAIENAQMVAEISDRRRLDYELQVAA